MSGVACHGGPERPLCEAVKMKPGLPWRPQDIGDARAARCLLRSYREGVEREKFVTVCKAG